MDTDSNIFSPLQQEMYGAEKYNYAQFTWCIMHLL